MKRIFDIIFALFLISLFCLPVLLLIFIAFIYTGKFPIISQPRMITLDKKKVTIYKIRTIRNDQESNIIKSGENIFYKPDLVAFIPPFCKWLRKSGLDEILQIINVLRGEMSFTGPRPLLGSDLEIMMKSVPELYKRRTKLNSTPGLTGMWQVYGDRSGGTDNLIELDEYYENNKSISLDLRLIAKSISVLVSATHSDAILSSTLLKKENCLLNTRKFITQ